MPVAITWIDAEILHVQLFGDIGASELETFGQDGLAVIADQRTYIVVDVAQINELPRNLINTALRSNALLTFANHPNARFFVFVAPNAAFRSMVDQVFRNTPYKIVGSMDEAVTILRDQIIPNDT